MKQDGNKHEVYGSIFKHINRIGMLCVVLMMAISIHASGQMSGKRHERIHALKAAYITDRLQLSGKQAEQFWPVYNQYEADVRSLRKSFLSNQQISGNRQNDRNAYRMVDENLDYQEALIKLKRQFNTEFIKVLSAQQMNDLYLAEHDFRQMLIQRIHDRK
ncbi:MAG: hypothetical protein JST52_05665 [Bacteroidetes bacterium]|nr:hypothetical protein [Bacteroidota bacterium]MBS1740785.1 hypothetical protein [Bacteroidota bacterium]